MLHGPYRVGPWPGLRPSGAAVLLGCALLLGLAALLVGSPRRALPDLPLLALFGLVPMAVATRIVKAPGAASAVCGAYLMPRTLISLVEPTLDPPPLLLLPALAFDVSLWLRAADLARLRQLWPRRQSARRRRTPAARRTLHHWRASVAGAVFGSVLTVVEPPYARLLGSDPSGWTASSLLVAGCLAAAACSVAAFLVVSSDRGTAS